MYVFISASFVIYISPVFSSKSCKVFVFVNFSKDFAKVFYAIKIVWAGDKNSSKNNIKLK